jgi:PTH1 family peptidyl-tRNA hydrolase
MKYLIVGLGNPGSEYENTKHNIGFKILNQLAADHNIDFRSFRYADIAEFSFKSRKIVLVKPNTFMNLSGKAVRYWMNELNINMQNILVVTDDISLSFGELRMREKGSDGGHNGLKNINSILGSHEYPRFRFGIGNDFTRGNQVDYVLSDFTKKHYELMQERINKATDMIKSFCFIGIKQTMSDFNGK